MSGVGGNPVLLSLCVCEDVLTNMAGRISLVNLFRDLYAERFPALARLNVVCTWLHEDAPTREPFIQRIVWLAPDRTTSIAESAETIWLGDTTIQHTQVARFAPLALSVAGTYRFQVWLGPQVVCEMPLAVVQTRSAS